MEDLRQLAERLYDDSHCPMRTREQALQSMTNSISYYLDDVFKLLKNINETSFNKHDRARRIIDMEAKYSIPKTHIIVKS